MILNASCYAGLGNRTNLVIAVVGDTSMHPRYAPACNILTEMPMADHDSSCMRPVG